MFGSFLPSRLLVGLVATKIYSAAGTDIVMESITPTTLLAGACQNPSNRSTGSVAVFSACCNERRNLPISACNTPQRVPLSQADSQRNLPGNKEEHSEEELHPARQCDARVSFQRPHRERTRRQSRTQREPSVRQHPRAFDPEIPKPATARNDGPDPADHPRHSTWQPLLLLEYRHPRRHNFLSCMILG